MIPMRRYTACTSRWDFEGHNQTTPKALKGKVSDEQKEIEISKRLELVAKSALLCICL